MRPETLVAQALHAIDATTGATVPPVHFATTYARDTNYELIGPSYSRADNPTPVHAERMLAALEGAPAALAFGSGMAAATAVVRALCRPGDHVIAPTVGYFAFRRWLGSFAARWGLTVDWVDLTDLDAVRAALRPGRTRLVWAESPANPTWEVCDLAALATLAHTAGARLAVDSTCATPVHTRPLALGADVVMHSATKYPGGHSDVLAGMLATRAVDEDWASLVEIRHAEGAVMGPLDAYLLQRGMRTLFARVERASASAQVLAARLASLPGVTVRYPGLPTHPQHALAARQMERGFGAMLSIQMGGGAATALAVVKRLAVWVPATSLGGVESLVEHRATVEGPSSPTPPDLLRLSVGLEHVDDLVADLEQALAPRGGDR